jgi:hypothetical protein
MNLGSRRFRGFLTWALALVGCAAVATAQGGTVAWPHAAPRVDPKEFGIQDETITVISAASFRGPCMVLATLARGCPSAYQVFEWYAPLSIPAGAVIDYIGVNNNTGSDAVMGAALWERDRNGAFTLVYGFSFPPHDWDTDLAGPLGILVPDHLDKELVLNIEEAASPNSQYFAWVEVRWHRTVSPPPPTPSFTDVPTNDFGYQYIEALKASGITGGCGGGNYCPDANLTRRQMAIFLAKALGLHWPN